jgi:hypothetical protein
MTHTLYESHTYFDTEIYQCFYFIPEVQVGLEQQFLFCFVVLEIRPRVLDVLNNHSTTGLPLQALVF